MTPNQCNCSMSIRVLGDGCRYCQPQEYIDRLIEQMQDDADEAKSAPAEPVSREVVEVVAHAVDHPDDGYKVYKDFAIWMADGEWTHNSLMTVAQHNRIMSDVRSNRDAVLKVMRARKLLPKCAPAPDAELVELLRNKFPRIDPCKPVPLDEKAHCCEYTIYVERERLHRMIDAKLASREVKP